MVLWTDLIICLYVGMLLVMYVCLWMALDMANTFIYHIADVEHIGHATATSTSIMGVLPYCLINNKSVQGQIIVRHRAGDYDLLSSGVNLYIYIFYILIHIEHIPFVIQHFRVSQFKSTTETGSNNHALRWVLRKLRSLISTHAHSWGTFVKFSIISLS